MADQGMTETRGLVLRADGVAILVTRGAAAVMPVGAALRALDEPGMALWLAGLTWRRPRRLPALRRVRLLAPGSGTWDEAREAYLQRWATAERGRPPRTVRWPAGGAASQ